MFETEARALGTWDTWNAIKSSFFSLPLIPRIPVSPCNLVFPLG